MIIVGITSSRAPMYHRWTANTYIIIIRGIRSPLRLICALVVELSYRALVAARVLISARGRIIIGICMWVLTVVTIVIVISNGWVEGALLVVTLINAPRVTFTH